MAGRKKIWTLTALGLTATALVGALAGRWASRDPASLTPIVLIVVDTLRVDHLGCYGYFRDTSPNIDALARDALLFENAMTPSGATLPAHVSLFSSTNPMRHGIRGNLVRMRAFVEAERGLHLMAPVLRQLGYQTAAFVSSQAVSSYTGLGAGFDVYGEGHGASLQRDAAQNAAPVLDWLDQADVSRPFFLFVHFVDPHDPYLPPESYRARYPTDERLLATLRARGASPQPQILQAINYYDGEIRYVDEYIGRLLSRMKEKGVYDRAALVFASDHGEGLGQHGWMKHGRIYGEQMRIPLIVRWPGRNEHRGQRFAGLVSLIDVLPTLAAQLDLPLPDEVTAQFEGIDVLGGAPREYIYAERADARRDPDRAEAFALVNSEWKLIHRPSTGDDMLFRVDRDPAELQNIVGQHPDVANEMRALLQDQLARYRRTGDLGQPDANLSPEVIERLRQLGYDM